MDAKSIKFLEDLCNSHGPSGFEKEPTLLTKRYVAKYVDTVYHDNLGNLFFERVGQKDGPVVLMPGHVDEVGFVITSINNLGYLTFSNLGVWFDQTLLAQRVHVMGRDGLVPGVIAAKPPHVMDAEERKKALTMDKMFIDVGASNRAEAEAMGIRIGDAAVPDSKFYAKTKKAYKTGKPAGERTLYFGKAFDNRISTFLVAEVMRVLKERKLKHPNRLVGCATVQEEVAYRGAQTAANFVEPDVAIVVDVDIAGDVPGIEEQQAAAKMGQGIAVTAWDVLCIPNQPLKELVVRTCERNKIPYQLTTSAGGGTDAAVIHKSNVGVPSISIGVPTRHIHSHVGIVDRTDLESSIRCLVGLVKVLDRETVDGLTTLD